MILTIAGEVSVSTLGAFFFMEDDDPRVIRSMQQAGFLRIAPDLASVRFERLHVYFFGDREPLTVGELLFYWQD